MYDIQELADDLGVEVEIDLHEDDIPQAKLDKELLEKLEQQKKQEQQEQQEQ